MRALPVFVFAVILMGAVAPTKQHVDSPASRSAPHASTRDTSYIINQVGDRQGYRYEPANLTIHEGDTVKFVMVSGGPHNVNFDGSKMSDAARARLAANIIDPVAELSTPYQMQKDEVIVVSFAGVPAGKYEFHCAPHLAMGQAGSITVVER